MTKRKTYTTFDIAILLDVYPTTVANWIDEKKLKAYTTPGGHRRVTKENLLEFIKEINMNVPESLLEKTNNRVLVVDDDEKVMNAVVGILEKSQLDLEIFTAADGFQAGYCLSSVSPCLVVLDLMLPGIDGFTICGLIKKMNINVKVLAITGYDSQDNKRKILDSGAAGYLVKPFYAEDFMKQVTRIMKK
ncbi:response regulator [Elusimicrobiota bacterium]